MKFELRREKKDIKVICVIKNEILVFFDQLYNTTEILQTSYNASKKALIQTLFIP